MSYTAGLAVTGRAKSAIVPPVSHQFPAGNPQGFAQGLSSHFLSKSGDSSPVLHTIFMRFISSFDGLIFISFYHAVSSVVPRGKRAKSKRNPNSAENSGLVVRNHS
jgi:hypothetical protein